jgi:hypothetical protein
MRIEEFLEVYTPQEIDKIETRRREDCNVQRNAILGKYGGNIISEKTRGRVDISPEKAVKIVREAIGTPRFTQCVGIPKSSPKKSFTKSPKRDKSRHSIPGDAD